MTAEVGKHFVTRADLFLRNAGPDANLTIADDTSWIGGGRRVSQEGLTQPTLKTVHPASPRLFGSGESDFSFRSDLPRLRPQRSAAIA